MELDPDAVALHALWLSLRGHDGVARLSALAPRDLDWCRDNIAILAPVGDGSFHYAHYGANLSAMTGFRLKGRTSAELKQEVREFVRSHYSLALERGVPLFVFNESAVSASVHAWRRHVFPLYADDGSPACVVSLIKPTIHRDELWRSISRTAAFGAGSLEPIVDDRGEIQDFLIVEAAGLAPLLGEQSPETLNQLLRKRLDAATMARFRSALPGDVLFSETIEMASAGGPAILQVDVFGSDLGPMLNMRDVTAVHNARAMLEKRTEELRLAQQIGRIGGWRMDVSASMVWWSPEMFALLRLSPGVFTPTTRAIRELYLPGSVEAAGAAQQRALATGQTQKIDVAARRGDGTVGHFAMDFSLERDASGAVIGIFGTIQDITERKEAEQELERLAYIDPLTGLPNRAMFKKALDRHVEACSASGGSFFLLLMDLDNFKDVNDTLGHGAGDALLIHVGRLLREIAPPEALVARLGGDEFAILFKPAAAAPAIDALAAEIVRRGSGSFVLDEGEVHIGFSIGIAEGPKDGEDAKLLLKNADLALYSAKGSGRGRYHYYMYAMSELAEERLALSRDLKKALGEDKLELHFQPLVALASHKVVGFEALLRWNHPERGYIPPAEFIPIAEGSSLICDLGFWAMKRACIALKAWLDAGNPPISVSVNVSAVQFWQSALDSEVKEILATTDIPAELLTLEVTESIFIDNANNRVRACFEELAKLGVSLAIDDFGTGFSSLGYLSELPFQKLKIDRSFITRIDAAPEKQKLLQGIIGLARGLGMNTVVEGAETAGEVLILQSLGCSVVQGFYFAKPSPFEQWQAMIDMIEKAPAAETPRAAIA